MTQTEAAMTSTGDFSLRPAQTDDLEPTFHLFLAAANALRARVGRSPVAATDARRERALAFRRHALAHDAAGYWIAEADRERVGFGIATVRERVWYLAALHVLPSWQGRGVGRALLRQCLQTAPKGAVLTTISESSQPVSNALYGKHHLWQWTPLITLEGSPFASRLGPVTIEEINLNTLDATLPSLSAIDQRALGYDREIDHRLWLAVPGMTGLLVRRHGEPIGYAYLSQVGGIGPVAARTSRDLTATLRASFVIAGDLGHTRVTCRLPGLCRAGLELLVDAGFHYDADIDLILASRPFGHLDRYLISAGDALF